MIITADINGFKTNIEIPFEIPSFEKVQQIEASANDACAAKAEVTGNDTNYQIRQGNLVEVGGVVSINTTVVAGTSGTEGSAKVKFPFDTLLSVSATAVDTPAGSIHESAHVGGENAKGMTIYATSTHSEAVTLKVRWSAKGLVNSAN